MADDLTPEPSGAEKLFGDFAPALVRLHRRRAVRAGLGAPELSPRRPQPGHRRRADHRRQHRAARLPPRPARKDNGVTEDELIEAITHLAFYAGWPKAMSAMAVAKQVFRSA